MIIILKKRSLPFALCFILLLTLFPVCLSDAATPALTSLTVGGISVDPTQSVDNFTSLEWKYDPSTPGSSGFSVLSLNDNTNQIDIAAVGDLLIDVSGDNHIGKLDVTGMLIFVGSGVVVVEEIANWGYVSSRGAAVFVNVAAGRYVLLNDAEVYDRVTLPTGEFTVPYGRTLTLAVDLTPANSVESTACLTVPQGSSLVVENRGTVSIDAFNAGFNYWPSVLEVKGRLTVKTGGRIENKGRIFNMDITIDSNDFIDISASTGGGIIECIGSGVIVNAGSINGFPCGYVTLKAGDSGQTPLSLNMISGNLILDAGRGHFSGGVKIEANTTGIDIIGAADGEKVVLDYIDLKCSDVVISAREIHVVANHVPPDTRYYHKLGQLAVTGKLTCSGNLTVNGVNLSVGSNITSGKLNINSASLCCGGLLNVNSFTSDFAAMNLTAVRAVVQRHENSLIAAENPSQIGGSGTAVQGRIFGNIISRRYSFYNWGPILYGPFGIFEKALSDLDPLWADDLAFIWDGDPDSLRFDTLYNSNTDFDREVKLPLSRIEYFYDDPCYPNNHSPDDYDHIFTLMYFLILGEDSSGQPRIWYIYRGSSAPDVSELYAIHAVNYFGAYAIAPAPSGAEKSPQSNRTGSGVLGGGVPPALLKPSLTPPSNQPGGSKSTAAHIAKASAVPVFEPMKPTRPAGTEAPADKTNNPLFLDGKQVNFPAVKIDGWNWLKLRDVAMILKSTSKQFSIAYDPATKTISITSGGYYTPIGDELLDMLLADFTVVASGQKIMFNGKLVEVAAYNIDGYNYFRLRDLMILLNIAVIYDPATGEITLDLTKPYSG